jgi:hypothetical protein
MLEHPVNPRVLPELLGSDNPWGADNQQERLARTRTWARILRDHTPDVLSYADGGR